MPIAPPLEQERPSQHPDDLKRQIHEMIDDMRCVETAVRRTTGWCSDCGPADYCLTHGRILKILERWIGDAD